MEQFSALIESKNKLFLKNKKYILENDWSSKRRIKKRQR